MNDESKRLGVVGADLSWRRDDGNAREDDIAIDNGIAGGDDLIEDKEMRNGQEKGVDYANID